MTCHDIDDYVEVSRTIQIKQEILQMTLAIISLLASLSIVIILSLRYKKLVEDKPFIYYIYMIAIADSGVSFSFSLGFPLQGPVCSMQGFLFMFFGRASWMFTLALIFQLYFMAIYMKVYLSNRFSFRLIWTLSLVSNLIPLAFQTWYGLQSDLEGIESCFYNGKNSEIFVFLWVAEQIIVFALILCFTARIIVHAFLEYKKSLHVQNIAVIPISKYIKNTMIFYPLAMISTWSPNIIYIFVNNSNYLHNCMRSAHPVYYGNYVNMLVPLYGFFLTIIFYTRTKGGREEWIQLIKSLFSTNTINNRDIARESAVDLSPMQSNDFI